MQAIAFLQNLNAPEIIMIFLVVLLFFGAKRLPDLFRSFGKSLREFKKATSDIEEDVRSAMEEDPERQEPARPTGKTEATTDPKQVEASSDTDAPETDSEKSDRDSETDDSEPKKKDKAASKA
jgi:sec-independent protein translocase protein TatA